MDEEMSKNSDKEMEIDDEEQTVRDEVVNSSDSDDENKTFSKRKKKVRCLSDSDSETLRIDETESMDNTNLDEDPSYKINGNGIESDSSDADSRHRIGDDLSPDRQKSQRVEKKNSMMSKKFEKLFQPKESYVENAEDYSYEKSKLSMICDSDSSDDENVRLNSCEEFKTVPDYHNPKLSEEAKNRGTQRMSAKIAMEQMQKIKSESSRMLREKEISLPYHRPKQISLKDIMAKKNIQFIPGAKKPNLRMNEEQLKEYVLQLEKREKEIQELYESSSDEDKDNDNNVSCNTNNETILEVQPSTDNANTEVQENETELIQSEDLPEASDLSPPSVENGVTINSNQTESSLNQTDIGIEDDNVNETEPNASPIENQNASIVETEAIISATGDIEKSFTNIGELEKVEKTISLIGNSKNSETDSQNVLNSENNLIESLKTQLLSSLPNEPKLSGTSGEFIEFTTNGTDELSGVNAFKKKFFYHANLKTPEEIEREKEKKTVPGTALMNFRRELEDQIREQKLQEWKRKKEESHTKNLEEKTEGSLSDCEEILEKNNDEEKQSDKDEGDLEKESDTEIEDEIEDDCIMIDKKKSKEKCDYIEDEAELDDDSFEDDENDNEETDTELDVPDNNSQPFEKKKLNRIYNPFEGSDSSDDNDDSSSVSKYGNKLIPDYKLHTKSTDTIPNKDSMDIFDSMEVVDTLEQQKNKSLSLDCSSEDIFPLGQKCTSDESLVSLNVNSYNNTSENLSSQVTNLSTSYLIELSSHIDHNKIQEEQLSTIADQVNKQLDDTNVIDSVSYTQEIADLCSGNFTPKESNSDSKCPESLVSSLNENQSSTQITQDTENELLKLCTGQFIGIDEARSEKQVGPEIVSNSIIERENKSAQVVQKIEPKKKSKGIESFLVSCPVQTKNLPNNITIEDKVENVSKHKHLILSSSSDEKEDCDETEKKKKRLLKSKRDRNKTRKAKPLEESDDESDNENENFDENDKSSLISSLSNADEEREINYDSEENEIEIVPESVVIPKPKTKKSSEFFEQEAELTTDDEWKGSGDEDERDLDEFEWEEGDADQLDQRKVNKELERIHRHQMLDQDSREIKILQDILLEDGDLEGGTREKKFRWKNIDNAIESGAVVGEENLDDFDDSQNEEQWRKQRYERETYLRELMKKETEQEEKEPSQIPTRLSIIKASLKQSLISLQSEDSSINLTLKQNVVVEQNNQETDKSNKKSMTVPSPIKKPFMSLQNQFKKSFLSKGQAALNRLSLLTKNLSNTNGENPSTNLSSLAPGKKKNFVFQTVSPPCNNNLTEDMKMKKRKAVSEITTPTIIKKMKLSENRVPKSRKSLIDHMD